MSIKAFALITNLNRGTLLSKGCSRYHRCVVSTVPQKICVRNYPAPLKRFYRKTSVLYSDSRYEITLDQRKLKTPRGNPFQVDSEPLALAVAAEWDGQKDIINQSSMHLTALCSTAIDNPNNLSKYDLANQITNYIETDTVLFHSHENDALYDLQIQQWEPVIKWFSERYLINISAVRHLMGVSISEETKAVIMRHLLSHNQRAVYGFCYAVETLKSVILAFACVERHIGINQAVLLSRLEEEFQSEHWGRVEWAHDLNQLEMQSRLAAAVLFIHFNSSSSFVKSKQLVV